MVSAPQSSVASARLPSSSSKRMEAVGQSTALLSAYLLKQSAGKWKRKRWNQRWFVLDRDNGVLRYFRHASPLEAVPLRSDAHGVLALKQAGASLVVQGDLPAGVPTPFCFTVVVDGQKEVRLCADTNAEFRQWTTAISAIISPVRAGSRTGEAKVAPARAVSPASSSSSAAELPSPLQSPVQEVKKVEVEVEEDTETVNEEVGVEPRQVMEQLHGFVGNNRVLLIALNPAIVLLRFGDASAWFLVALAANALCVWLLWFRKVEPCRRVVSPRSRRRRSAASFSPASSTGSEVHKEKPKPKRKSSVSGERVSSSSVDEVPQPKRATLSGEINGLKTSAGVSLKMCSTTPAEIVPGCWTQVDATRFNIRQGPNYRKTKMKAASAPALLELIAVDVYQSVVKADNVGSIVDLSVLKPVAGDLDLFIVNCQVPSYQPSNPLWGEKQGDGPGFNFVTYFAIPPAIRKMLDAPGDPPLQAVRLLKGFMQPQSWVSERFKAIGIVVNPEEQKLGRAERHLLETYNGQPILTRPQHQFYRGNGYFEVDVNAHDFNYVARKGLVGVSDHACNMILDFGFVLEGQEDHELPEQILGSVRLCKVDVRQAPSLS
ncbi:hypothetical protein PF008_g27899 [Phytophthora fragariae]|uniref:PH domain-containing protein n=1 Tax=Phytophthora fragariae TaxID=53985 RepID=A0A6G0QDP7_9STRA|nr:hypothetical protein PF008_g27899 [Phytophthora fragariae]